MADDEGQARLYRTAERALAAAGYRHYEIANWAREGKSCEHNLVYWRNGQWLGVGTGSYSHLGASRSRRPASLVAYLAQIERDDARIADASADDASDTAMLALRLDEGLDLVRYARRCGASAAARIRAALADPRIAPLVRAEGDVLRLTPRGRLLASEVFVRLLGDDERTSASSGIALAVPSGAR